MMGALGTFLGWLVRLLFGKKDPTAAELAASNATAQTQLASERAANEIITDAAAARADADRVRGISGPLDSVVSDPGAPINRSEHGHFRD